MSWQNSLKGETLAPVALDQETFLKAQSQLSGNLRAVKPPINQTPTFHRNELRAHALFAIVFASICPLLIFPLTPQGNIWPSADQSAFYLLAANFDNRQKKIDSTKYIAWIIHFAFPYCAHDSKKSENMVTLFFFQGWTHVVTPVWYPSSRNLHCSHSHLHISVTK